MTLLAVLALGFALGVRHATDADHVVAMSTLISRERSTRSALALGALWGVGHTLTLMLVGGAIVVFGLVVPPRLGLSLEMSVALMLILLGARTLTTTQRLGESHTHAMPAAPHAAHPLGAPHSAPCEARSTFRSLLRRGRRSLLVGTVHGLAGSAAVALLVLASLRDNAAAVAYLAVFGAGTLAGMLLLTFAMAVPLKLAVSRFASAEHVLARTAGAVSLALGLFLAYRIGFVDGLFAGDPTWTPD